MSRRNHTIKYVRKKNSLKDNMEKILDQMSGNTDTRKRGRWRTV